MTRITPRRRLVTAAVVVVAAASLGALVAMPTLAPKTERATINDAPVEVAYLPAATAKDLGLPFYQGAVVQDSFAYTVTGEQGQPVLAYASALLTTPDSVDVIVASYRAQLPGAPEPQVMKDEAGERTVFALGQGEEVRTVTITAVEKGSRIELIRTTKLTVPPRVLRPHGRERAT